MAHQGQQGAPPAIASGAEAAFVCDDGGVIVAASETIGGLLGRSAESMRGQPLAGLAEDEDAPAVAIGLAAARREGGSSFSARLRAPGRAPVPAKLTAWWLEMPGASLTLCLVAPGGERRVHTTERARRIGDTQKVIATILELALQEIPLEDLLRRTLDLILSIPWLSIERKGAIFLVEHEPKALVMKAERGLSSALLSSCARVPFGSCLCGLAAAGREPVYAASVDERHATRYPGLVAHGHYCVPICGEGATLGVITAYLAPGHERSPFELEFLMAVANTLAGVLVRRRADHQRRRAEHASRAKSEFLALVSHELLTPVTAVMLSCERLERDRATPLSPRQAEILGRMEGALDRLASRIRLLLEHARLDGGRPPLRLEPVDLANLAGRVVEELRPDAERKGLALRLALESPLPVARTDERLLAVVLANLASNAVKFTSAGSVAVTVGYRGGSHVVTVEDTGPGIPPGERSRIFDPFEPLEPLANKHVPGMGLGLALARRLADALGARLELDPAREAGSSFVLTLPAMGPQDTVGLS